MYYLASQNVFFVRLKFSLPPKSPIWGTFKLRLLMNS
jgi:hypothetical protein